MAGCWRSIWMTLVVGLLLVSPLPAAERLGVGQAGLLGGDLTDPDDAVRERPDVNYGQDLPEDALRPIGGAWRRMKFAPASPPGSPAHQRHAYQSWQGTPACALFLNQPEKKKWYVGFKDGGQGGPTEEQPYYCAVEFENAHRLTHFTLTTAPDMPGRDPKVWALQGSNTGADDDWVDIYRCQATDRGSSPLQVQPRSETTLFAGFTAANMAAIVGPDDLKKLRARLGDRPLAQADFTPHERAYTWYRLAVYECFNPNGNAVADVRYPPGFSLGQLELFGVAGKKESVRVAPPRPPLKPPASKLPFMITYWCGPPRAETNLVRYQELAEAGFNVAFPAIDHLWTPADPAGEAHNQAYLDLCQKVGIKALVWDGAMPKGQDWKSALPEERPRIEQALDGIVSRYSSHPALLGYVVHDEPNHEMFPRLALVNQYLLQKDPEHLPFINLLPQYAFPSRAAYEQHVAKFLGTVRPALVSWDHYRQVFGGGDESTYWSNLELMRRRCAEAGLPFNQIICSLKHMGYRECSEADLRWQVYTSLAFGSRGISYFTYWYVRELAWAQAPALLDQHGKRDQKFDFVKRINRRIAQLGPTLVQLVCTGAYCTDPLPPGGVPLPTDAPVLQASGGPLLIGVFQDAAQGRYLFPVNRSFSQPATFRLKLREGVAATAEVSQETGELAQAEPLAQGERAVTLAPGEGRLFRIYEQGIVFSPPAEFAGGRPLPLEDIRYLPADPAAPVSGKLFWRRAGETPFENLPLARSATGRYQATLPAAATQGPLEYYLEFLEGQRPPAREPAAGPDAPRFATPDLTPPTAPGELAARDVRSYRVRLEWQPARDDRRLVEYRVFRGVAERFELSEKALLGTASLAALSFTDAAPPAGRQVWYAVQAVDAAGRLGEPGYVSVPVPEHQPPRNDLRLSAAPGSKSVRLTWTGDFEPNVEAIEIHRRVGPDDPWVKIGETRHPAEGKFLDSDVKLGQEYQYAARPRSSAGLLGPLGTTASAAPLRFLKRINCGGPEIASEDGVPWEADAGDGHPTLKFAGSRAWRVSDKADRDVFHSERWSNVSLGYAIPVEPGRYEVVLHFAETNPAFAGPGKRRFNVELNGQQAAEQVDVFAQAGGPSRPWKLARLVTVTGAELQILLRANPTGPALKALEIRALAPEGTN